MARTIHPSFGPITRTAVECLVRGGANLDLRGHESSSARDMAREWYLQEPTDARRRRIAQLCGVKEVDLTYGVRIQHAEQRTIAAVHARLRPYEVPRVFRKYLDQVYAERARLPLDGQNVFLYRKTEVSHEIDAAFGVGVTADFEAVGAVQPTQLPSGNVATTTHIGSYATLRAAHSAVVEWCRANGHRLSGTSWEVYGHWTEDESKLRTDVFYLLS